jgi:hypothetical protein
MVKNVLMVWCFASFSVQSIFPFPIYHENQINV